MVSGSTAGALVLSQAAIGGVGEGTGLTGQDLGGNASSTLTFVDARCASLTVNSQATSGAGLLGTSANAVAAATTYAATGITNATAVADGGGFGGSAISTATAAAANPSAGAGGAVIAIADADGVRAGQGGGQAIATATYSANGERAATAQAVASGYTGSIGDGLCSATATGHAVGTNISLTQSASISGVGGLTAEVSSAWGGVVTPGFTATDNSQSDTTLTPASVNLTGLSGLAAAFQASGDTILAAGNLAADNSATSVGSPSGITGTVTLHETDKFQVNLASLPSGGTLALGITDSSITAFDKLAISANESISGGIATITLDITALEGPSANGVLLDFVLGVTQEATAGDGLNRIFSNPANAAAALAPGTLIGLGALPAAPHASFDAPTGPRWHV
jgi:hypothetical protein